MTGALGRLDLRRHIAFRVRVFAFDSPLGVPTCFALSDDRLAENPMLVNGGAGCHLSPAVALSRALTEAAQSRLSVISGSRKDFSGSYGARRTESYADATARGAPQALTLSPDCARPAPTL